MFQNMRKYEIPKLLFFSLMNAKDPKTFSWGKNKVSSAHTLNF